MPRLLTETGNAALSAFVRAAGLAALVFGAVLVFMFAAAAAVVIGLLVVGAAIALRFMPKRAQAVKRLINRVSVEASFFKKLSPMENLIYAARLYNMPGGEARAKINQILVRLGIPKSRIGQPLENMSRGMQQKVAIARAFLTSPIVLLTHVDRTGCHWCTTGSGRPAWPPSL